MLILGLILLAAAVVAAVEGIIANTAPVTVHMWGWSWTFDLFWAAVCGAGIIVLALLGLWLIQGGSARAVRVRRDHHVLVRENERLAEDARTRTSTENRAARPPVTPPAPPAPGYAAPGYTAPAHAAPVPRPAPVLREDGAVDGGDDGGRQHRSAFGRALRRH